MRGRAGSRARGPRFQFEAAWPLAGLAQEAGKLRRIGFLRVGEPPAAFIDGFRRDLREVGLIEGRARVVWNALSNV